MGRIAFAVSVGALLAGHAMAACPDLSPQSHPVKKAAKAAPCVSLNAVPQISAQVVAAEPLPAVKHNTYEGLPVTPYQGPVLGLTKPDPAVRPVPTVGFHWSLE
ncbi:MAG TPA: hypothetical protein VG651_17190 [Stellaceae bacterium]|nr:hypothetical protein [Stellaceae bacterium]